MRALPLLLVACSSSDVMPGMDGSTGDENGIADATFDATFDATTDATQTCTTTITYGVNWIRPANHPDSFDVLPDTNLDWDGNCTIDGASSFATLSNGWKPYFQGHGCTIAIDHQGSCIDKVKCTTRVRYGPAWIPAPNHPNYWDDVDGRVYSDGACKLSNGWMPQFNGNDCDVSFAYHECGGLYANPVVPFDCPDPGVVRDASQWIMACTSGNAANAYPIYTSPDLVTWKAAGHIFPSGKHPVWAVSDFWAPEIHKVGAQWVAYFSARGQDGMLAIGAASSPNSTGPFTDIGKPLIHDAQMGLIDVSEFDGYVLWKEDGNAVGKKTPIHAQAHAADGLSLTGSPATLITNDQQWEGNVVEGPWMVQHAGTYFLFYSGAAYNNASYAVGVAKSNSPLGPFTKAPGPILVTGGAWAGPGHCSVVDTPRGNTAMVYHAWKSSSIGGAPGRLVLVDTIDWSGAWPNLPVSPSRTSRPPP